jgi:glyoxylase-like metal-dependent hydrolase (beta-lactamase superfamily II)
MKQISGNIYQISLGMMNVFIIEDNGLTLIDTGPKGSADKIFRAIEKGGKDPNEIKGIILTHAHPNHSGSADEIKTRLNIPILAHYKEAVLLNCGIARRRDMQLSPGIMNWLIFHFVIKHNEVAIDPVIIDDPLSDNHIIPIAGGIKVIHTPGHSSGHIALLIKNEGILIAGDICTNTVGLRLSVLYEDFEQGIDSIMKAAEHDFEIAVFSHGKPIFQDASRKIREKFNRLNYSLA